MATDFPQSGDDEPISLGNSRFDVFDHSYATDVATSAPDVWVVAFQVSGVIMIKHTKPGIVQADWFIITGLGEICCHQTA